MKKVTRNIAAEQERLSHIRLGLCCTFVEQPIKFFNTTVAAIARLQRPAALEKLAALCRRNAESLQLALQYCSDHGIGCFRVNSQILPIKSHEVHGYAIGELPGGDEIVELFKASGRFCAARGIRTCFHPDQFIVLSSPRDEVVSRSLAELEYQAQVAEWIGADVLNIHAGGAYGNPAEALLRFSRNLERLSDRARSRLTVENDDVSYRPRDLLDWCRSARIPLVYDVHHHRCLKDDLSIEQATELAIQTWNREPMFHISSPLEGWEGRKPNRHHDYVSIADFPACWRSRMITVEVEAKAKELAVLKLKKELLNGSS